MVATTTWSWKTRISGETPVHESVPKPYKTIAEAVYGKRGVGDLEVHAAVVVDSGCTFRTRPVLGLLPVVMPGGNSDGLRTWRDTVDLFLTSVNPPSNAVVTNPVLPR